jgi:hypothetical protein
MKGDVLLGKRPKGERSSENLMLQSVFLSSLRNVLPNKILSYIFVFFTGRFNHEVQQLGGKRSQLGNLSKVPPKERSCTWLIPNWDRKKDTRSGV